MDQVVSLWGFEFMGSATRTGWETLTKPLVCSLPPRGGEDIWVEACWPVIWKSVTA